MEKITYTSGVLCALLSFGANGSTLHIISFAVFSVAAIIMTYKRTVK